MSFWDVIKKDTTGENETNKIVVLVRILSIVLNIFSLFSIIVSAIWESRFGVISGAVSVIVGILILIATYNIGRMASVNCFLTWTLLWVIINLQLYGWFCGAQTFLLVMIMMFYFASYANGGKKTVFSGIIFIIYMLLFFEYNEKTALITLSTDAKLMVRALFMGTLIICTSVVAYLFSHDSQTMESKLIEYNKMLKEKANTDPLTGLLNRGAAMERLVTLDANLHDECLSICICDIDFFKKVNDTYGHNMGDQVLIKIGEVLKQQMKGIGFAARWGGEEFLLIFPRKNGDEALQLVYGIQSKIRNIKIPCENGIITVTMTFGLTEYDFNSELDYNIMEADNKLYVGKDSGRNKVVY